MNKQKYLIIKDSEGLYSFIRTALTIPKNKVPRNTLAIIVENNEFIETITIQEILLLFPAITSAFFYDRLFEPRNKQSKLLQVIHSSITLEKFIERKRDKGWSSIAIDLATWQGSQSDLITLAENYIHYCIEFGFLEYIPVLQQKEYKGMWNIRDIISNALLDTNIKVENFLQEKAQICSVDNQRHNISDVNQYFDREFSEVFLIENDKPIGIFQKVWWKQILEIIRYNDKSPTFNDIALLIADKQVLAKWAVHFDEKDKLIMGDTLLETLKSRLLEGEIPYFALPIYDTDQNFVGVFDYKLFLKASLETSFKSHIQDFFLKPTKQPKQKASTSPKQSKIRE